MLRGTGGGTFRDKGRDLGKAGAKGEEVLIKEE